VENLREQAGVNEHQVSKPRAVTQYETGASDPCDFMRVKEPHSAVQMIEVARRELGLPFSHIICAFFNTSKISILPVACSRRPPIVSSTFRSRPITPLQTLLGFKRIFVRVRLRGKLPNYTILYYTILWPATR